MNMKGFLTDWEEGKLDELLKDLADLEAEEGKP